jgi:hypothetical protein
MELGALWREPASALSSFMRVSMCNRPRPRGSPGRTKTQVDAAVASMALKELLVVHSCTGAQEMCFK